MWPSLGLLLLRLILPFLKDPTRKLNFTNHLIMLHMHDRRFEEARKFERTIQADTGMKSMQCYILGDFLPSDLSYSSKHLQILCDTRVSQLSAFLISGLEKAEEWVSSRFEGFQTCLTCFFMNGTGPSPFNAKLGDIYLKVGHYNPVVHDREIVQHAVIHELTHIYLRNKIGFRAEQSEYGIRKFFDEGFAQYCGYQSVAAYARRLAHANTCSAVVVKKNLAGLIRRIDDWDNTLFNEMHYPLYQASLSFIGFIEEEFGYDCLLALFKDSDEKAGFADSLKSKAGAPFSDLLSAWVDQLPDPMGIARNEFFIITSSERLTSSSIRLSYQSEYPLYPVNDVFVLNSEEEQLGVTIKRAKRYEKAGEFVVSCEKGDSLSLTIVFDDLAQRTEIGKTE